MAKTIVGTDAQVGIGWLSLSGALMNFHAFSPSGQKEVRIWWRPSAQPATIGARGADKSTYPLHQSDQMPWRIDPSWRDLVTLPFAAESPFHGDATLWPIHGSAGVALGEPSWQVEYRREDGGVSAPPVFYELVKGTLSRGSHRHYSRPSAFLTRPLPRYWPQTCARRSHATNAPYSCFELSTKLVSTDFSTAATVLAMVGRASPQARVAIRPRAVASRIVDSRIKSRVASSTVMPRSPLTISSVSATPM